MPHPLNFATGWWFILAAFVTGTAIGLGFHREDFLDGYALADIGVEGQIDFAESALAQLLFDLVLADLIHHTVLPSDACPSPYRRSCWVYDIPRGGKRMGMMSERFG